jgi:hypothetical protein
MDAADTSINIDVKLISSPFYLHGKAANNDAIATHIHLTP